MATLTTDRTLLRPLEEADFEGLLALYLDPAVRTHLITKPADREAFSPIFAGMVALSAMGRMWAVLDRASGTLIGRAGLYAFGPEETPELAYLIGAPWWGQGLATEIASAILDHAFGPMALPRIMAIVLPANAASARVLVKNGFRRHGVYDHPAGVRADVYERLATDS